MDSGARWMQHPPAPQGVSTMKPSTFAALVVLVLFAGYTAYPVITQGYFGFVAVHTAGPWGVQVVLDLFIALTLFLCWMVPDARERGLPAWPFVVLTILTGSIGALAYLVVRGLREPRSALAPSNGAS
jgi:hypothetical protein